MYKQTLSFILIFTWLVLLPPVLAHDQSTSLELTAAEHAWLAAHPEIRLGADKNWGPYVKQLDNGDIVGVEPDLIARLNALTGANIHLVLGQWAEMVKQAERGDLDGLAISTAQPEREALFQFSNSAYSISRYIYARGGNASPFHSMADLAGKQVAFQHGVLAAQKILAQWPAIIPVPKDSPRDLSVALLNGEVDAVLGAIALRNVLREELFSGLDVAFAVPNSETHILYSIRKDHPELLSIINKALAAIGPAEILEILAKWGANYEAPTPKVVLTEAEQAWIKAHPEIHLGIDKSWTPFVKLQDNGDVVGIEPDLLARINALTGANIQLALGNWTEMVAQAERGELHGLAMSAAHPERAKRFLFSSSPYGISRFVYAPSNTASTLRSLEDLAGKRVGLTAGNLAETKLLAKWPKIIPVPLNSGQELAVALMNHDIDAAISGITLLLTIRDELFPGLTIAFVVPDSETKLLYSIRKEYPELLSIINKALAVIGSAEVQGILEKWGAIYNAPTTELVLTDAERAWLREHPKIVLGSTDQFQPYLIAKPDGSYEGLVVDYLKLLNQPLGNRLELHVDNDWGKVTDKAIQHEIDGLAVSSPNPTWDQHFLYTDPYSFAYYYLYLRTDATNNATTAADLAGQRVGYLAGVKTIEYLLRDVPGLKLIGFNSNEALVNALLEERVEVLIGTTNLEWWRKQHGNFAFKTAGMLTDSRHPMVMSIRNDWKILPGILNKALNNIPTAEQERIRQRWLSGPEMAPRTPNQITLSTAELAWLRENRVVHVRIGDFPPYHFWDNGPRGISVELLDNIAKNVGVQVEYLYGSSWTEGLESIRNHTGLDMLPTAKRTPERETFLAFSKDYLELPWVIFTRETDNRIFSLEDLFGKTIAVEEGYAMQKQLTDQYPQIKQIKVREAAAALLAVSEGKVDAYIGNLPVAQYHIGQRGISNLKVAAGTSIGIHTQAFAVRKDWAPLATILEKGLATIPAETRNSINRKYFSLAVTTQVDYTLLWQLTGMALLIIGIVLYWNRRLAREIILRKHVEDELARERSFLKTLIATIPDLVWLKDPNGVYLACNPRVEQLFGAREADIVGKTDYDFVAKELADFFRRHDMLAMETDGVSINEEEVTFANDGHAEQLETTKAPMRDAAGRIIGVLGIGHDITVRKHLNAALESERSRLHNIIEGTSEGFWLISADQRILGVNAALCRMLGYRREELLGHCPHEFADEANQAIFKQLHWQLATTDHHSYEIELRTQAGVNLPTRFHATTLHDAAGQFEVAFAFVTDMKPYKEYEKQLIQAKLEAEAANRAKSAFIANMSHELRTPLNAVLGFAQILQQDPGLDNHQLDHVQRIQRGGEYLLTLINDILDLAKIEAGRFELFPAVWNTQAVFHELSYMFHIRAEQKGIAFQHEPVTPLPQSLYSDDKRLRQVLINLLGNAVKFTEHGTVTLRTGYEASTLCLEVVDSGIGIATEDLDKIFKPFQQTGSDRYKAQGTGLGLAITHRLVQTMGGTLQVNSTLGQGSVFRVEIPAEVVSTATEAQLPVNQPKILGYRRLRDNTPSRGVISQNPDTRDNTPSRGVISQNPDTRDNTPSRGVISQNPSDGGPMRILVVDDLEDNREVVHHLLEPLGFQIAEAENGQRCLDLVPNYQPDLILMDLRMPELDGLEATRTLRAQGFQMPIIILSASTFANDQVASLEAGGNAHLAKPVRLAELLDTLAQWLRLEWEYAAAPNSIAVKEEGPLETLTADEAAHLRHLALRGDIMAMQEFVEQLATNHRQLSKTLNKLIKAFEFEKILEVVEKCKGT